MLNVYYESRSQGTPKEIHMEFLGLLGVDSQGMPDVSEKSCSVFFEDKIGDLEGKLLHFPRFFFVVNPATYNVALAGKAGDLRLRPEADPQTYGVAAHAQARLLLPLGELIAARGA